jgi:hypothetical protein
MSSVQQHYSCLLEDSDFKSENMHRLIAHNEIIELMFGLINYTVAVGKINLPDNYKVSVTAFYGKEQFRVEISKEVDIRVVVVPKDSDVNNADIVFPLDAINSILVIYCDMKKDVVVDPTNEMVGDFNDVSGEEDEDGNSALTLKEIFDQNPRTKDLNFVFSNKIKGLFFSIIIEKQKENQKFESDQRLALFKVVFEKLNWATGVLVENNEKTQKFLVTENVLLDDGSPSNIRSISNSNTQITITNPNYTIAGDGRVRIIPVKDSDIKKIYDEFESFTNKPIARFPIKNQLQEKLGTLVDKVVPIELANLMSDFSNYNKFLTLVSFFCVSSIGGDQHEPCIATEIDLKEDGTYSYLKSEYVITGGSDGGIVFNLEGVIVGVMMDSGSDAPIVVNL